MRALLDMGGEIHLHDVVALLEDMPATHFETGQALLLRRGQVGTVVLVHDSAFEVEFAGTDGRPSAVLPVAKGRLTLLRDTPA